MQETSHMTVDSAKPAFYSPSEQVTSLQAYVLGSIHATTQLSWSMALGTQFKAHDDVAPHAFSGCRSTQA